MEHGLGENFMSSIDYQSLSDAELVERLEQGDLQSDFQCYAEFIRRMEVEGTLYHNTPEDEAKWSADIAAAMQQK
jgi:hypothetical protein